MNPFRLTCALRCVCLALLAAIACLSGAGPAAADRIEKIRERGHLIVGVKADYQPFGFRDSAGRLVGYDVDVARAFAEKIGVSLELVPVTSANRLQKVEKGEIDIAIATLGDTRSRRKLVTMVEPQYYGDGANVLMREESKIDAWSDLRGRALCSIQGSLWSRLAEERLLIKVVALNSTREAGLALQNGHCVGWIYDEVNLLNEMSSGEWEGYKISLPTRFVLPWAVAIAKNEAGGALDRLLGDTLASWHRTGFLQNLEKKWSLPPSPYLRRARTIWQNRDVSGDFQCRRNEDGNWPLECREVALISSAEVGGISGISLTLMEATGLDVSVIYDPLDRKIFITGIGLTVALSVLTVLCSLIMGPLFGWVLHRRILVVSHLARALCVTLSMTPPLLQLYGLFFGLGGVVLALGFTLDAFTVAATVLTLYAGSSNAVVFSEAADLVVGENGKLPFRFRDLHRAHNLCHAAVMGNSVNIVKATGMASTVALPELVHASTAIVAEKGNVDVMMNLLLVSYFVLVIATVQIFRFWGRRERLL